jgi:hypothetical protein
MLLQKAGSSFQAAPQAMVETKGQGGRARLVVGTIVSQMTPT